MKVFCIGFHKTGTTSLAQALTQLGLKVTGPNGVKDPDIAANALPMARELVPQFDAFQDNPWPILYRELYADFPDAHFILTYREPKAWINSQVRHFGEQKTPMREWIYGVGCPAGNESVYLKRYQKHNQDVAAFFNKQRKQLLIMNLAKGDGWEKLCPHLGFDVPSQPFPHANQAESRERFLARR